MARTVKPFYNISSSVGRGVGGFSKDVMLIQYMLWHILVKRDPDFRTPTTHNYGALPGEAGFDIGPEAIFPMDGVYKSDLDKWITLFQMVANARGIGPLVEDGRVAPALVGWGLRSRGKAIGWSTMQALNLALSRKSVRPYGELPSFSSVPVALAAQLKLVQLPDGK